MSLLASPSMRLGCMVLWYPWSQCEWKTSLVCIKPTRGGLHEKLYICLFWTYEDFTCDFWLTTNTVLSISIWSSNQSYTDMQAKQRRGAWLAWRYAAGAKAHALMKSWHRPHTLLDFLKVTKIMFHNVNMKYDKKMIKNGQKMGKQWINLYHSFKKVDKYGPKKTKNWKNVD